METTVLFLREPIINENKIADSRFKMNELNALRQEMSFLHKSQVHCSTFQYVCSTGAVA